MFKVGDRLILTNRPNDIDDNWNILGVFYRGLASDSRGINCLLVVLIDNTFVETMGRRIDPVYCKPVLYVDTKKTNFKFKKQYTKEYR